MTSVHVHICNFGRPEHLATGPSSLIHRHRAASVNELSQYSLLRFTAELFHTWCYLVSFVRLV